MSTRVAFRQADLVRALKAAGKAGLTVQRFEVDPDGRNVVVTGEATPKARDYLAEWQIVRAHQKALSALKGWDDVGGR